MSWPPLPARMAGLVAAQEAEEQRQAEQDAADAEQAAWHRARMAEIEEHRVIAQTGHTSAELRAAREAVQDRRDATGWDPAATPGTPQHPEVLLDGGSLARAVPQARRAEVPEADRLLARARQESALGAEVLRRARSARRQEEISRLEVLAAEEAAVRSAGYAPAPPRPPRPPLHPAVAGLDRLPFGSTRGDW